jgi:hypothetical protein
MEKIKSPCGDFFLEFFGPTVTCLGHASFMTVIVGDENHSPLLHAVVRDLVLPNVTHPVAVAGERQDSGTAEQQAEQYRNGSHQAVMEVVTEQDEPHVALRPPDVFLIEKVVDKESGSASY